ncbi:MAG: hypothetical protein HKP58_13100 [Desulfatitalea sp.]|nr:outer membrane protein transport protein [Desulfatitalea sp.]NNK01337.1 hypothetical protein [Desulfatitalea sp.]
MRIKIVSALLFCSVLVGNVFAAGWDNPVVGTRGIAMGYAYTGAVDDASAVFWNPAGLTQIEKGKTSAEFRLMFLPTVVYTMQDTDGTEYESTGGGVSPEGFVAISKGDLAFGMGLYSAYGAGGMSFEGVPFMGMIANVESTVGFYSLGLSAAYKVLPDLSIGGTWEIEYGMMKTNTTFLGVGSYDYDYSGLAGHRFALGMLYSAVPGLNFGLQIKSEVDIEMEGKAVEFGVANNDSKFEHKLPYYILAGIAFRASPKMLLSFDYAYRMWGSVEEYILNNATIKTNWRNNSSFSLGAEYTAEKFVFRGGVSFTEKAMDPDYLNALAAAEGDLLSLTAGVGYKINADVEISTAYVHGMALETENPQGQKFSAFTPVVTVAVRSTF